MANFSIPRATNQELAGNSDELVGKLVALRSEGVAKIKTEFGVAPATRTTAVAIGTDGYENMGLRLIFWSAVQETMAKGAEWVVGRIVQVPQAQNPDRTVYVMEQPAADEYPLIDPALDSFLAAEATGALS